MFGLYSQYADSFEFYLTRYEVFSFDEEFILQIADSGSFSTDEFEYAEQYILYV